MDLTPISDDLNTNPPSESLPPEVVIPMVQTEEPFPVSEIEAQEPEVPVAVIDNDVDDFEAMINQSLEGLTLRFKNGEQVKGRVSRIDGKSVYINLKSRQDGIIDRAEFLDKEGNLSVNLDDEVEAMVLSTRNDTLQLTVKMDGLMAAGHLSEAYAAGIPVEGRFKEERKGGYTVDVGGVDAFCPYSQADLRPLPAGTSLVGVTGTFLITQLSEDGDVVVSRRRILERDREKQKEALKFTLKIGDRITGEVTRIMEFGAFVDLGGTEGLIPAAELSWSGKRVSPSDMLREGDRAEVIVKAIDWERDRISLSYRGAKIPWEAIADQYRIGSTCRGTVMRIEPFGVFVEIGDDVDGLLHISQIANALHKRIKSPGEIYKVGDEVTVRIESIDDERHRISLTLPPEGFQMGWDEIAEEFAPGTLCEGIVTRLEPFGAFVELEDGLEGLLHISRIGNAYRRRIKTPQEVLSVGEEIIVEVEAVDPERRRISLSLPEKESASAKEMEIKMGDRFDGIVKFIKPFGVVIELGGGLSGLLHQSQTGDRVIHRIGDCVPVIVSEVSEDKRRISLILPDAVETQKEEAEIREWLDRNQAPETNGCGAFDNAFNGLKL